MASENGPFIVDFPIKNGDFPVRYVAVYQRVNTIGRGFTMLWEENGRNYSSLPPDLQPLVQALAAALKTEVSCSAPFFCRRGKTWLGYFMVTL
jgi:hypothetical protein